MGIFSPAAVAPPKCDNPRKRNSTPEQAILHLDREIQSEQVSRYLNRYYIIIALSAGAGRGGQALSPPSSSLFSIFPFIKKE